MFDLQRKDQARDPDHEDEPLQFEGFLIPSPTTSRRYSMLDDSQESLIDSDVDTSYGSFSGSTSMFRPLTAPKKSCYEGVGKISAVVLATLITVMDNVPYGLLIFPSQYDLGALGVKMVLFSAAVAQVRRLSSYLVMYKHLTQPQS